MSDLSAWLDKQARSESRVVRLEDALLTNSFERYFFYRLRFLLARTAIATAVHALKIVLLLGAFPRSEFLTIVIAQATVALVGDFWWGALEQLRSDVRLLQRRGRRDLVPREIARWLSLSVRVAVIPVALAAAYAVWIGVTGQVGPVNLYVVVLLGAMAIDFIARTYHSGAYAMRRVYRPLPSLFALDVVSVGALLGLWPFMGLWAFPVSELVSALVVFAISIHYTTNTYRTLALPTLMPLLRLRRRVPALKALRGAVLPGVSYALVGLEGLIVVAGIAGATTAAGASLVVLLAALGPVSRASFEWARLLYFDLKRLELPMLADLRRKFDAAVMQLALVMGFCGAALAVVVTDVLLPSATALLFAALVALFVVRSVLAAAQMQAFTRTAYVRLSVAGVVGACALVVVFWATANAELRLFGVAGALGLSLLLLLSLPAPIDPSELLTGPGEWLRGLRLARAPVRVARLNFDARDTAPGVTGDARRAEAWRREAVAQRLAARVTRHGGAATWVDEHELWLFEAGRRGDGVGGVGADVAWLVRTSAGLLAAAPTVTDETNVEAAARTFADAALRSRLPGTEPRAPLASPGSLMSRFAAAFPSGFAYDLAAPPPTRLTSMPSDERVEIYRAAIRFARGLRRARSEDQHGSLRQYEITALVDDGVLRAVFAAPRAAGLPAVRAWRRQLRAWNLRRAAGFAVVDPMAQAKPETVPEKSIETALSAVTTGAGSEGAAML